MSARTISFPKLQIDIAESEVEVVYTFSGDVDENFKQHELPRIKKPKVKFDLEKVNNFNSIGVREWIFLMRDFSNLAPVEFLKCSVSVIDQVNMIPDSAGKANIASFFAPYFCDTHGELNICIDSAKYQSDLAAKRAPAVNCSQCGKPLHFDALEESYFLFAEPSGK